MVRREDNVVLWKTDDVKRIRQKRALLGATYSFGRAHLEVLESHGLHGRTISGDNLEGMLVELDPKESCGIQKGQDTDVSRLLSAIIGR